MTNIIKLIPGNIIIIKEMIEKAIRSKSTETGIAINKRPTTAFQEIPALLSLHSSSNKPKINSFSKTNNFKLSTHK